MQMLFDEVERVSEGVWLVDINPDHVRGYAPRGFRKGRRSVVLVTNPRHNADTHTLTVPVSGFEGIVVGESRQAIMIDQSIDEKTTETIELPTAQINEELKAPSFPDFMLASLKEGLPHDLIREMVKILRYIGKDTPFELHEGKARKWTSDPNFVAITIQNRNKVYLISVKGDHRRMNYKTINPVAGRGISYSEFHFSDVSQYNDVLDAVRKSSEY